MAVNKLKLQNYIEENRLIRYIDFQDDCWIWTGAKQRGYGIFGLRKVNLRPHRVVWFNYVDDSLPDYPDATLDHICENRACVNPDHLEPKSIGDNVRSGSRNYASRTHCPQGHEYDEENTYITPNGARQCKTCVRYRNRIQRLKFKG